MPDILSVQWDFSLDTWFYAGSAVDESGNEYSINLYFARNTDPANPLMQFVTLGLGIGNKNTQAYHSCDSNGVGLSETALLPATLTVPRASDSSFSLTYVGGIAGPTGSMVYVGGAPVGMAGALYKAQAEGVDKAGLPVAIALDITDSLGTRMEGQSAYVGQRKEGDPGLYTYEVAQPCLTIEGGTLTIGSETVTLTGGNLWHDRQTYTGPPPTAAAEAGPPKLAPLYRGNWIALVFDNGLTAGLNAVWPAPTPVDPRKQWITGRSVGRPPEVGSSGNLYFPEGLDRYNGGAFLSGGGGTGPTDPGDDDWDYDVNILDPSDSENSPHWTSPNGNTYCTAWSIAFSERLAHWKVPPVVYLVALVGGCEHAATIGDSFWEGAVDIFEDRACTRRIGRGFFEQMGYD
jgi:hypothetical protein